MNSDVYGYYIIKAAEMQQTYGKELLTIFDFSAWNSIGKSMS